MKLYHVSEKPDIGVFEPRPSPSHYDNIKGDVVFSVSDQFLYNYLVPRDCPRVSFYADEESTRKDCEQFIGNSKAKYVLNIEERWKQSLQECTLYCYSLPGNSFSVLDKTAGYYISYDRIVPDSMRIIQDVHQELVQRNVELRFLDSLKDLADSLLKSSLNYSLIRMKHAI